MQASATVMWLKIAGLVPLALLIGLFTLFAVGEAVGGDLSGLFHFVQAAPLVILAILAWVRPRLGGLLLAGTGGLLMALYVIRRVVSEGSVPPAVEVTRIVLLAMVILSGWFFLMAARKQAETEAHS